MAQVQLFKSIFDNYLDRFDSAAKREVEFATAIDNARKNRAMVDIYNSQEQRALSQENRLMDTYNRETPSILAGLSLNKNSYAAQEKRLIDTMPGQEASNQSTNIMADRQLRDQQINKAIGEGDFETLKRLKGAKDVKKLTNGAIGFMYEGDTEYRTMSGHTQDQINTMQGTADRAIGADFYNSSASILQAQKSAIEANSGTKSTTNTTPANTGAGTTPPANGSVLSDAKPNAPTANGNAINQMYAKKPKEQVVPNAQAALEEKHQEILRMQKMSADPNSSMPWAVRKLVDFGQGVDSFFGASQPAPSVLAPAETFAKRPMLSQEPTAFDLSVMSEGQAKARGLLPQWLAYRGRTE